MPNGTAAYNRDSVAYETTEEEQISTQVYLVQSEKKFPVYSFLKRCGDLVLSVIALVLLSPLCLLTAVAVKLEDGGPVIYSQIRAGKNGKPFKFYKFRSMCVDAEKKRKDLKNFDESDGPVFKITHDPRITKVGKVIRKSSIDELPQLANILRGDMTIVGPRPPLPDEVAQYTPEQMHRLDVKPGLTCYWQCSGRSDLSFEKWMELDFKYIQERGFWTDLKIILKTVPAVLLGRGAY